MSYYISSSPQHCLIDFSTLILKAHNMKRDREHLYVRSFSQTLFKLARAIFFNRLGEIRERSFENQRYRASGLNLVLAAIILWNTVYLERAILHMKEKGYLVEENLLKHLSPLSWEHINLTGDYVWRQDKSLEKGEFRPLREHQNL